MRSSGNNFFVSMNRGRTLLRCAACRSVFFFFFCRRLCYYPVKGESKKLIVVLVIIFFFSFFQERISELGDSIVSVHFRCANGTADNQGSLKNTKFQNRKRISRLDRLVFFFPLSIGGLSLSLKCRPFI